MDFSLLISKMTSVFLCHVGFLAISIITCAMAESEAVTLEHVVLIHLIHFVTCGKDILSGNKD